MEKLNMILIGIIQTEPNSSIDYQIANYILNNINSLSDITAENIALTCNTSKASVSRFCKRVGLNGFPELKYYLNHYELSVNKYDFSGSDDDNILHSYLHTVSRHIHQLTTNLDFDIIDEITNDIHRYSNVIIAGTSQSNYICLNLQLNLFDSGKLTHTKVKFSDLRDLILSSDDSSLLIIFSVNDGFFERIYQQGTTINNIRPPRIYLITATTNQMYHQLVYKTLEYNSAPDFASGSFQLEAIAKLIALNYHNKYKKYK